jgi:GNAT superfamily N-acetyltransferase
VRFRPLLPEDAPAVHEVAKAAFEDLALRSGHAPPPPPHDAGAHLRIRHVARTDPEGAWVAEADGRVAGAALALMREGLWGLSLLVVHPALQSRGTGRALLELALRHGEGARGHVILSSDDPRALRTYARAGLTLTPAACAEGVPRGVEMPDGVRPLAPEDRPMTDAIGRHVRGAAHGEDLEVLAAAGAEVLVLPHRGFAAHRDGVVRILAALDEEAARTLLRALLSRTPEGRAATVSWLTGNQAWAVGVALDAGLELSLEGAIFRRGDTGRFAPYLPSGAFL